MTDYAAIIAQLTAEQRGKLKKRLSPLSFSQEQFWLLQQFDPSQVSYNIHHVTRVRGSLVSDLLRDATAAVVNRHAVLRTSILDIDETLFQIIHEDPNFAWAEVDLTHLPSEAAEREARERIEKALGTPFDLQRLPLLRVLLFRFSADHHILAVVAHHIVMDAISVQLFVRELAEFYEAAAAGRNAALNLLSVQYADFAAWQRAAAEKAEFDDGLAYWTERLRNLPPRLDFFTRRGARAG